MRKSFDSWYIRLPDGRVVRAKSTESVRHNVERGRIPLDCWVRRSPEEEWQSLEWTTEFTDLVRRRIESYARQAGRDIGVDNGAAPRSTHELRTVGAHGFMEELFTAFDTTLARPKLLIAALAGLVSAVTLLVMPLLPRAENFPLDVPLAAVAGLILLVLAVSATVLTQITFVELSRLRPARRGEATHRLMANTLRIVIAFLLIGGLVVLAVVLLRQWPGWLLDEQTEGAEMLASLATVLALTLEVMLWPISGLALLLVPIIVIEECGVGRAFGQWLALLQQHLGRIFIYEALALALGAIAVLPLLLPLAAAGAFAFAEGTLLPVKWRTLTVLAGLTLSPLFAYLVVANVSIYLNLRYEIAPSQK